MSLTESVADPKFFAWQDKPDNFKMTQIGTFRIETIRKCKNLTLVMIERRKTARPATKN